MSLFKKIKQIFLLNIRDYSPFVDNIQRRLTELYPTKGKYIWYSIKLLWNISFVVYCVCRGVFGAMQTSIMELFAKIVTVIFAKKSIIEVWQGPKCNLIYLIYLKLILMLFSLNEHLKCQWMVSRGDDNWKLSHSFDSFIQDIII